MMTFKNWWARFAPKREGGPAVVPAPVKVSSGNPGPQVQPALQSFNRAPVLGLGKRVERQLSSRPFGAARDDTIF